MNDIPNQLRCFSNNLLKYIFDNFPSSNLEQGGRKKLGRFAAHNADYSRRLTFGYLGVTCVFYIF